MLKQSEFLIEMKNWIIKHSQPIKAQKSKPYL